MMMLLHELVFGPEVCCDQSKPLMEEHAIFVASYKATYLLRQENVSKSRKSLK